MGYYWTATCSYDVWLHTLPVEGSKRQSHGKMVCFVFHSCVLIQRPAMHWRHAQVPSHRSWSAVTPITSMAWVAAAASANIMDMNNTSGHPSGNTEELFFLCDIDLIISRATSEVIIYFITHIIIYIYIFIIVSWLVAIDNPARWWKTIVSLHIDTGP